MTTTKVDRDYITGVLAETLPFAINTLTGTTVAAVAVTEHCLGTGMSIWLAGTSDPIHAEQVALASSRVHEDGPVLELWLTDSRTEPDRPATVPCGGCAQLIADFATVQWHAITVVSWDPASDRTRRWTIDELLPHAFRSRHLRTAARDQAARDAARKAN